MKELGIAVFGATGIAVAPNVFMAGILYCAVAAHFGRTAFLSQAKGTYWWGIGLSLLFGVAVAVHPAIIPIDAPVQFKMGAVGFFVFPILAAIKSEAFLGRFLNRKKDQAND
jgi:hypothetical protein